MNKLVAAINSQLVEALFKSYGVFELVSNIQIAGIIQQISKNI